MAYLLLAVATVIALFGIAKVTCPRCRGERWVCEAHPDQPSGHDACIGPGEPCPLCNVGEPPDPPLGFVSLIR